MEKEKMKIKMILYDKDGILVDYLVDPYRSSWDGLSLALPEEKRKKWIEMRDFYVDKPELYDEWFSKQVGMLKGLKIKDAEKVLFPIPYSKGVEESFKTLNGNYIKGIVSSGIDIVARRICEEQCIDFFIANVLGIEEGAFNGLGEKAMGLHDKLSAVEEVSRKYGVLLNQICFVGDSFNDISVLKKVGLPITFNPKSNEIKECAKYTIYDFRELNVILSEYGN